MRERQRGGGGRGMALHREVSTCTIASISTRRSECRSREARVWQGAGGTGLWAVGVQLDSRGAPAVPGGQSQTCAQSTGRQTDRQRQIMGNG